MPKNLSKEELDRAYNNSLAVPNSAQIIECWAIYSEQARKQVNGQLNICYGSDPRQSFDYFPADKNSPVVVFIHGGYWQLRSKDDFSFIVPALNELNISVAILGYRLAPHVAIKEIIADIQQGLNTLELNLKSAGKKFKGFCLIGWSAGAHLMASVMNQKNVYAGVGISGIYDLGPILQCYVNDQLRLDEKSAIEFSPILNTGHFNKPIDLFVGTAELPEMQMQTKNFARYRSENLQDGVLQLLESLNHYTVFDELINPAGQILKAVQLRVSE